MLTCNRWNYLKEDKDTKNKKCHQAFVFGIQKKCKNLHHKVNIALKEKGDSHSSWYKICENALVLSKSLRTMVIYWEQIYLPLHRSLAELLDDSFVPYDKTMIHSSITHPTPTNWANSFPFFISTEYSNLDSSNMHMKIYQV